jgi:hypothetical protein
MATLPVPARIELQSKWANDIPLKFLWTVQFNTRQNGNGLTQIGKNINKILNKYERRDSNRWPVRAELFNNQSESSNNIGYLFASTVAFPGDNFQVSEVPIDNMGGFIPAYAAGNRSGYGSSNKLDITFIETNIDVLDYFIRPWIIACSHKGLIETGVGDPEDLKCHITISFYTRTDLSDKNAGIINNIRTQKDIDYVQGLNKFQLRKGMTFYNAVPFNIAGDQISYGDLSESDIKKTVSFTFSHYNTLLLTQINKK